MLSRVSWVPRLPGSRLLIVTGRDVAGGGPSFKAKKSLTSRILFLWLDRIGVEMGRYDTRRADVRVPDVAVGSSRTLVDRRVDEWEIEVEVGVDVRIRSSRNQVWTSCALKVIRLSSLRINR